MSTSDRLNEVYHASTEIPFDDNSRIVLFSDCHRGINDWADNFAPNQNLFFHAVEYYFEEGFTYIEVGDGDELFENTHFSDIRKAHSHVFWMLRNFFTSERFHLIYGNHDMERKDPKVVENTIYYYYDERTGQTNPLFDGITVHEGIRLRYTKTNKDIFLVHGHQGDHLNDRYWKVGRFLSRHFWRHAQLIGFRDPASPAKNFKKRVEIEQNIINWSQNNNQMVIAGHTHRPRFPLPNQPLYFNLGSCVHPRCITGIEIKEGKITLIKWWVTTRQAGALHVVRQELAGPKSLEDIFSGK